MTFEAAFLDERWGLLAKHPAGPDVFFAPVAPRDAVRLRAGVRELTPAARYLRFFSPSTELTDEQVRRFTEVDQVDHVAWGALDASRPGAPGVAIGRFLRESEEPTRAEFAIVVVDRFQNRRVGSALLAILFLAARRRSIRELRALVLPDNDPVLAWFERLGASVHYDSDACDVRLPVEEPMRPFLAEPEALAEFDALLRQVEAALPFPP